MNPPALPLAWPEPVNQAGHHCRTVLESDSVRLEVETRHVQSGRGFLAALVAVDRHSGAKRLLVTARSGTPASATRLTCEWITDRGVSDALAEARRRLDALAVLAGGVKR